MTGNKRKRRDDFPVTDLKNDFLSLRAVLLAQETHATLCVSLDYYLRDVRACVCMSVFFISFLIFSFILKFRWQSISWALGRGSCCGARTRGNDDRSGPTNKPRAHVRTHYTCVACYKISMSYASSYHHGRPIYHVFISHTHDVCSSIHGRHTHTMLCIRTPNVYNEICYCSNRKRIVVDF